MKYLLLTICLLLAAAAHAQDNSSPSAVAPYRYCVLVVNDRLFSFPDRLQLDYGQSAPGAVADPEMTEMARNIKSSRDVVDALNYLSRHNWELFNVTTIQTDGQKSGLDTRTSYVNSETRYLLRRRL